MVPRLPSSALLVAALALGALSACGLPEGGQGTPTEAHYRLIAVRAADDLDGLWALLDPAAREELERWLVAEKLAVHEIETAYPAQDRAKALAAIGDPARAQLPDAKALFARVLRGEAPALGLMRRLGARVSREERSEDGTSAVVHTHGGDKVRYVKGPDGAWYYALPPVEMERLRRARARAEENLKRVRANLAKLHKRP